MRKLLLTTALAFGIGPMWALAADPNGPVMVTIGGEISQGNRPALDADAPSFFSYLDVTFDKAMGFDAAMLASMPQKEIRATVPGTKDVIATFSGPRLSEVAAMAGFSGDTLSPVALDGYQVEIALDLITAHDPILATHQDGKPLGIGGYGPAVIVFPDQGNAELDAELNNLEVWAIFYISAE